MEMLFFMSKRKHDKKLINELRNKNKSGYICAFP